MLEHMKEMFLTQIAREDWNKLRSTRFMKEMFLIQIAREDWNKLRSTRFKVLICPNHYKIMSMEVSENIVALILVSLHTSAMLKKVSD
jgi:hypothetical protein